MSTSKLKQNREFTILPAPECCNGTSVFSQHGFDVSGRTVPASNPHHTGNRTGDLAALLEIRVLGHDDEAVLPRKLPYGFIGRAIEIDRLDMRSLREYIKQKIDQPWRQILVEQQLHVFTVNCIRSRSAA